MRKIISYLILCLLCIKLNAQPPRKFYCRYGGNGVDVGYGVKQCLDTNYIIVGSTTSYGSGSSDIYLLKIDSMGQFMWHKTFGGFNQDVGKSIALLPDGGFVITGYSSSYGAGGYDVITIRTDKFGNQLWLKSFGGLDWDFGNDVIIGPDGNIVVCGSTYSYGFGSKDGLVIKYDLNGNLLWHKQFGGTLDDELNAIIKTNDNMLATCGQTKSFGEPNGDSYFVKLDLNGDTIFTKKFGGSGIDYFSDLLQKADLTYEICGAKTTTSSSTTSHILCMNGLGAAFKEVNYYYTVNTNNENFYANAVMKFNPNITNSVRNVNLPFFNYQVSSNLLKNYGDYYKINENGGTGNEFVYGMESTIDGGAINVGKTTSFGAINDDIYVLKQDSNIIMVDSDNITSLKEFGINLYDNSLIVNNSDDEIIIKSSHIIKNIRIINLIGQTIFKSETHNDKYISILKRSLYSKENVFIIEALTKDNQLIHKKVFLEN